MEMNGVGVIVTGGASGLGGATAKMLADRGAKVAIFDLNEEVGKAHAESIGGLFVRVNVSDEASVEAGLAAAEAAHGVARILVNCAGLAPAIKTVGRDRSEEHTSELQSLMRISYAVFCLTKKKTEKQTNKINIKYEVTVQEQVS